MLKPRRKPWERSLLRKQPWLLFDECLRLLFADDKQVFKTRKIGADIGLFCQRLPTLWQRRKRMNHPSFALGSHSQPLPMCIGKALETIWE